MLATELLEPTPCLLAHTSTNKILGEQGKGILQMPSSKPHPQHWEGQGAHGRYCSGAARACPWWAGSADRFGCHPSPGISKRGAARAVSAVAGGAFCQEKPFIAIFVQAALKAQTFILSGF